MLHFLRMVSNCKYIIFHFLGVNTLNPHKAHKKSGLKRGGKSWEADTVLQTQCSTKHWYGTQQTGKQTTTTFIYDNLAGGFEIVRHYKLHLFAPAS